MQGMAVSITHELSTASLIKLISFLSWSILYIYNVNKWPAKVPEWHSRLITLLHGTVATVVGIAQCGFKNLTPCRLNMPITRRNYALMAWSWGYFAFDLLWCALQSETWLMLCHHLSALVAITMYMHKDYTGCTFACNLAMMEVTNPLLQARWFLRHEGYQNTTLYFMVEVTYFVMFFVVRGILGTYLLYRILHSDMFDVDEKIISLVIYAISVGLLYEIMGYLRYRYKRKVTVL